MENPFGLLYRLDKCFSAMFSSIELYIRLKSILEKIIKTFLLTMENSLFCLLFSHIHAPLLVTKEKHVFKMVNWVIKFDIQISNSMFEKYFLTDFLGITNLIYSRLIRKQNLAQIFNSQHNQGNTNSKNSERIIWDLDNQKVFLIIRL